MISIFLNELSLTKFPSVSDPAVSSERVAASLISSLIAVLREGKRIRLVDSFRLIPACLTLEIAPGYSLLGWLADPLVSREERAYLRLQSSMAPYIAPLDSEIKYRDLSAVGIGAAYYEKGAAASLQTNQCWGTVTLGASVERLGENAEVVHQLCEVRQISAVEHWLRHQDDLRKSALDQMTNGQELLSAAKIGLPNIEFCTNAAKQINALNGGERYFPWLRDSLEKADRLAASDFDGDFPHARLPGPATGESYSVHQSPRLADMRTFTTLDGQTRMFEHHMKNLSENKRIHYYYDTNRRIVSIGYFGDHLETAKH